jgi:hypothetical protein
VHVLRFQDNLGGWGRVDALDLPEEQIRRHATVTARLNPSRNATALPMRAQSIFNVGAAQAHAEDQV